MSEVLADGARVKRRKVKKSKAIVSGTLTELPPRAVVSKPRRTRRNISRSTMTNVSVEIAANEATPTPMLLQRRKRKIRKAKTCAKQIDDGADGHHENRASIETMPADSPVQSARKGKKRKRSSTEVKRKQLHAASVEAIIPIVSCAISSEAYRKLHEIVVDAQCPDPLQSFESAAQELGATLTSTLYAQGFKAPTPIQAQAWPLVFQGKDIVGVAKTGSGKTCSFLMPALARIVANGVTPLQDGSRKSARPSTLVIAPTRELVSQIFGEAEKFSKAVAVRTLAIYGGVSKGDQVRSLQAGADVLVCTPGRLVDLMDGDPSKNLPPAISLQACTYLVLDEADKMLDMGFEAAIRKVIDSCPKSGSSADALAGKSRQTLFFTATWPKQVHKAAAAFTSPGAVQIRIGQGASGTRLSANASVVQIVHVIKEDEKPEMLRKAIQSELQAGETAIVFAARKKTCDWLAKLLSWRGEAGPAVCDWCKSLHGDKEQWERETTLAAFRDRTENKGKQKAVLVATDVASRGLDIPGVALVVIYDFNDTGPRAEKDAGAEAYVHRIGRTGRAGKQGKAITLYTREDNTPHKLAALLRDSQQAIPPELAELAEAAKSRNATNKSVKKNSAATNPNRMFVGTHTRGKGAKGSKGGKGGWGGQGAPGNDKGDKGKGKGKGHSGKGKPKGKGKMERRVEWC